MKGQSTLIPDDLFLDARRGDSDAISRLWDVCEPLLAEGLRHHPAPTAPTLSSSDVGQEAARLFLEALRGGDCPTPGSLRQFLARKLPYRLQSYVRAERRRLGRQLLPDDPAVERVLSGARPRADVGGPPGRRVARAMERLSPRQRAVISDHYFRDESFKAISDELGISHQAVSAVHARALEVLRKALSEQDPGKTASDAGT